MDPDQSRARFSSRDQIEAFVAQFNAGQLPKSEWNHDAHVVVGLWHALNHPPEEALRLLRQRIRTHNESVGTANTDTSGYHETLTRLYLLGLLDRLGTSSAGRDAVDLTRDVLASEMAHRDWPLRFHSRSLLAQPRARHAWVDPDLHPAPAPVRGPAPAAKAVDGTPRGAP